MPLAVRNSALQTFWGFCVMFDTLDADEVRRREAGRSDPTPIEVLSGLAPSTEYVVENSYFIMADIEKFSLGNDH